MPHILVCVKQTNYSLQLLSMHTYLCSTHTTSRTIKIREIKDKNLSSNQRGQHTHGVEKYLGDSCMFCCFFFKEILLHFSP